jgi:hypothetical protein
MAIMIWILAVPCNGSPTRGRRSRTMSSPDDGSLGKDLSDWGSEQPCDGCSSEIIAASHCSKKAH